MENGGAKLRLAVPARTTTQLHNSTIQLLRNAGYEFDLSDERRYIIDCDNDDRVQLILRKASDIPIFVNFGTVDLGITGHDWVVEYKVDQEKVMELLDLRFGECRLVLAKPEEWKKEKTIIDLYIWTKENKETLRIATEYPNLTREFLYSKGLKSFTIVQATGAMESLPRLEAHMIADLVTTGYTLKANRLEELATGGTILESSARLICNKDSWDSPKKNTVIREFMDNIESAKRASFRCMITANLIAKDEAEVVEKLKKADIPGLAGPTISPVYILSDEFKEKFKNNLATIHQEGVDSDKIFAVNIVEEQKNRFRTVERLRKVGGSGILVYTPDFLYEEESKRHQELKNRAEKKKEA